ncbi:MAG: B12-binding domain-containing radical SAM protein [Chloroflexi bacterium]|nr:B12-binding domain-containing radical SAM protein [Chloroflexota bacterium]
MLTPSKPNQASLPKLRLVLISPRGPLYRHRTGIWKKSLRYMPLTLTTLASLVPPELNAEVILVDEGIADIDRDLEADLVGISAITGTAPRSYELAGHFRRRGLPVVLGGVHPTLLPEEAARHADSVVVGYAEETWPQLLRDFVAGRMQRRYDQGSNLSLTNLPFPRRDLLPARDYTISHTIEATRGCIHHCDFCVVPTAWGRPLQRPVAEVIADIRQMRARRLIFLDLNLIADIAYAKELFSALIPLELSWGGLVTTIIAWDEELLDLAARSGCRGLLIGFETLSQEALVETNKAFSMRQDYREVVRRVHDRGSGIQETFVFGFDHHTAATFAETMDFAISANIDLPRYAVLTPFPGTPLFQRLKQEGRILTEDWTLYDGQHVVYQPHQLTTNALLRGTEWAWKETYSYRVITKRLLGSRIMLPLSLAANLGYRFYAHHLHDYYNCDWYLGQQQVATKGMAV